MEEKKRHRRGGKNKKKGSGVVGTIILVAAIGVFCVSGWQLYKIVSGYQKGKQEYNNLKELVLEAGGKEGSEEFSVNFDELLKINEDTIGWIQFNPEPKQINYPVVQGPDNDLYLNKTFSKNENTVGSIFMNVHNNKDFNDKHSIVYGHRMNDNSMFHDLAKFEEKEFWEKNQNFYIYAVDGRKITYQIYSAGSINEVSDSYITEFSTEEDYQNVLNLTKAESAFDTGIEVSVADTIVTLSTCVQGNDELRFVVRGVKRGEEMVKGE